MKKLCFSLSSPPSPLAEFSPGSPLPDGPDNGRFFLSFLEKYLDKIL